MTGSELSERSPSATRAELSFEQTVPRALAHRAALAEVFVADSAQVADDEFLVAIQAPRAHSLWYDRTVRFHDPLVTVEAGRQGTFVVVHRHLDVPLGVPFSLQRIEFRIEQLEPFRDDERTPLEAVFGVRLIEKQTRGDSLAGMTFEGALELGGATAMTMAGTLVFLEKQDYEVLRALQRARKPVKGVEPPAAPEPIDPARVGRLDRRNVVIGERSGSNGEARYPVIVDQGHPAYFDHGQDHMPGPLIVEAYRQAAIDTAVRAGAVPSPAVALSACSASFADFAEHEAIAEVSAEITGTGPTGDVALSVGMHQFGKQVAEAEIELRPYP